MFEWNVRDRDGGRRGKKVKSSGREVGKRVERAENNINLRKRGVIDEGNYEARKVCVCLAEILRSRSREQEQRCRREWGEGSERQE